MAAGSNYSKAIPSQRNAIDFSELDPEVVTIIYDGECPFCDNFVKMSAIRQSLGPTVLLDARSSKPLHTSLLESGYDLDGGMVVIADNSLYFGPNALNFISKHSEIGVAWAPVRLLARALPLAKVIYPILKVFRRATLFIIGRKKI